MKFSDGKLAELDAQIKSAINDMATAKLPEGRLPAGRRQEPIFQVPEETITVDDGRLATLRFHKTRNVYQLAVMGDNGKSEVIKEAANLTELTYDLLHDQAQDTLQRQDVEIENERIEKGLLADYDEVDEKSAETADWLQNYHYGQIYFETIKPLSHEDEQKMYSMTMGMLGKLRLPLTAPNLDLAFRELWDTNDEYAGYIEKANAEKQRLADKAAAVDQAKADQDAKIYPDSQPATPYAPPFVPMRNAGTKRYGVDARLKARQLTYANRKGI
jgi:hypothetical protein